MGMQQRKNLPPGEVGGSQKANAASEKLVLTMTSIPAKLPSSIIITASVYHKVTGECKQITPNSTMSYSQLGSKNQINSKKHSSRHLLCCNIYNPGNLLKNIKAHTSGSSRN